MKIRQKKTAQNTVKRQTPVSYCTFNSIPNTPMRENVLKASSKMIHSFQRCSLFAAAGDDVAVAYSAVVMMQNVGNDAA